MTVTGSTARVSDPDTSRGSAVEFVDVVRDFGSTRALDGLSLSVGAGELVALLGPSGCGKTTALRILAGFEKVDAGSVLVGGRDVVTTAVHRREMGMVFQGYSLFPTMSATDNVAFGLRIRGKGGRDRRRAAAELLDLVGLAAHADKFPHQLSGGQQQRVALARALAVQPRVLLLDEPLSALDAKVRVQLREEIRRIQLELGVTTIFVTHDQEEALSMADRIAVMREGVVEQCAPPDELYQRPTTPFVAEFVGTMNHLPGLVRDGRAALFGQVVGIDGTAPPEGSVIEALVRPEAVHLEPLPEENSSATAYGSMPGQRATVVAASFFGSVTRVRLLTDQGVEVLADVASHDASAFPTGRGVQVSVMDRPVLVRTAHG